MKERSLAEVANTERARADAAQREVAELRAALADLGDDYMTSDVHHPHHVLIPVAIFERLRELGRAVEADQPSSTITAGLPPRPTLVIPVRQSRTRKPTAPRTCCPTHTDTCRFGRSHQWGIGWIGGPKSGVGVGEPGWHDSALCVTCMGICTADLSEGGRP